LFSCSPSQQPTPPAPLVLHAPTIADQNGNGHLVITPDERDNPTAYQFWMSVNPYGSDPTKVQDGPNNYFDDFGGNYFLATVSKNGVTSPFSNVIKSGGQP
jgi:hypothetical protein